MTLMHEVRAYRLALRIETENDLDCFAPVRAFVVRVEEPDIGDAVAIVICRHLRTVGRLIFKWWNGHVPSCFLTA